MGREQRLKIISAGHCAHDDIRSAPGGVYKRPNPPPTGLTEQEEANQLYSMMPPTAHSVRMVAKVAGRGQVIPITSLGGPNVVPDPNDKRETFRSNDYALLDSNERVLENLMSGKNVPSLCTTSTRLEQVTGSVVIGFGVTNNGERSNAPLCGDQKIAKISDGIIEIERYQKGMAGACPADSGGGLWAYEPTGPCLMGVVSGPRMSSLDPNNKVTSALEHCTQNGLVNIYASIYKQQDEVLNYMNGAPTTTAVDASKEAAIEH